MGEEEGSDRRREGVIGGGKELYVSSNISSDHVVIEWEMGRE